MKFNVVSLFSGGGGLDIGFKLAGFDIIWAIDIDQDATNTYKKNVGTEILCGDLYQVDEKQIPRCDFVIGGPPCQSFSLAGKRNSDDKRGRLVWRYIDIINELQPKGFLFENVTGLMSAKNSKGEKILPLLLEAFRGIGYKLFCKTLNAADYGVPQLRRRVIIVGLKESERDFEFPHATHNADGSSGKKKYVSVKDCLGDLPIPSINSPITEHSWPTMSELDKYICKHVKPGGNYMDIPDDVKSVRIKRLKREGGHTTCYGRLDPDKPAYTINTYFNRPNVGCNIHYSQDRLITLREAMRLQTFPDDYEFVANSKQAKNRIVGNAVPPILAYQLALQIRLTLENEKTVAF